MEAGGLGVHGEQRLVREGLEELVEGDLVGHDLDGGWIGVNRHGGIVPEPNHRRNSVFCQL